MVREINWKKGDFEVRTSDNRDGKPYCELIKWNMDDTGRRYCFTIAYFHINHDGYAELHFVNDRPFTELAELNYNEVMKELFLTQMMLSGGDEE